MSAVLEVNHDTELFHVVILVYEVFIHHGIKSSFYRVVLEIKKKYINYAVNRRHHLNSYTSYMFDKKVIIKKVNIESVKGQSYIIMLTNHARFEQ